MDRTYSWGQGIILFYIRRPFKLKRLFRRSQPPPAAKIAPFIRPHINIGYGNDQLDGVDSLQELIEFNARHNPDHIFCTQLIKNSDKEGRGAFGLPHWITFAQLLNAVERAAAWLVKSGFTSGRTQRGEDIPPVAIYLSSDISIFIYIAALLRIGTPVLLLSARLASVALQHLIEETSPSCILVNSHLLERTASEAVEQSSTNGHLRHGKPVIARALGYENFINPQHPDISGAPIPPKYVYVGHEDANCIIFHSSGTTGLPKPVSHSHAYLLIIATCHRLQEYSGSKGSLCTLPLYHGYALLPTMLSMSLGMPLFLMPSSMIPTGRSTVDALNTCQPGLLFTVPSILEEMVSLPDEEGLQALKKLDIIPAGGAPMKENIGDYLRGHGIRYLNHWGCTELGPMTPIEVPDLNVDWRWLRPRTDHSLRLTSFDNSHTHFQISGQLPGWKSVFEAQDLLVVDPPNPIQYKLGGRQDNLILLSTGEKVLPAALENELSQHPDIKELCAFGEGQVALGVLVELKKAVNHDTFLREIRPYLDRGNAFMDKHGKVHPDMIIVTSEDTKPLVRTDKNSLARKASVAAFNEEISSCYSQSSTASLYSELVTSLRSSDREARVESIREIVTSILEYDEIEGSSDIFEAGMDSYQANRLRRSLEHSLNSPSSPPSQRITLEKDFCFRHPTIDRLNEAIERLIDEQEPDDNNDPLDPIATMMTTLGKYRELMLESLMSTPVKAVPSLGPAFNQELQEASSATVLITGSTGSLGCYLLSRLTRLPNIAKVICLCRRHPGEDPVHRQRRLLAERGAKLDDEAWEKISLYEVDFNRDDFGVSEGVYEEFLQATHIIHNAWPVSFKRTLSSFEQQIRITIALISLAHRSTSRRQSFHTTRLAFISSIAVAGRYTSGDVPEERLAPEHTLPLGYAEAKWVAEELLLAACEHYQTLGGAPTFKSSIMRVGQISGAEESGAWNELEQIPLIMRTSERLGCLPALEGTLSWLPVNRTADSICDLLFSQQFSQFSHIENPSRQPWDELIRDLSEMLSGSDPILTIPFFEWLDIVRSLKEDDLITSIVPFLERDFSVIGCGEVVLSTKKSRAGSATLAQSGPIGRVQLSTYVDTWRSSR